MPCPSDYGSYSSMTHLQRLGIQQVHAFGQCFAGLFEHQALPSLCSVSNVADESDTSTHHDDD